MPPAAAHTRAPRPVRLATSGSGRGVVVGGVIDTQQCVLYI
eukprot:COSAG02_NODE_8997_length_2366_cov_27.621085_2_plen_41_part_00